MRIVLPVARETRTSNLDGPSQLCHVKLRKKNETFTLEELYEAIYPNLPSTEVSLVITVQSRKHAIHTCYKYFSIRKLMLNEVDTRIPTVKLKIPGKSIFEIRNQNFCYIQVIVFDLSYLPVVAVGT